MPQVVLELPGRPATDPADSPPGVLTLDLALTSTGWARLDGEGETSGLLKPRGRGIPRLQDARRRLLELAEGAALALIEGYSFASRNSRAHALGELGGVVRVALAAAGLEVVEIPPKCLKKTATGRGNAPKEAVLVAAVKRLGYAGSSTDIADALWLLEMARQRYALPGAVALPEAHLAGLEGVEWPDALPSREEA